MEPGQRRGWRWLVGVLAVLGALAVPAGAGAVTQTLFNESFRNATTAAPIVPLTANTSTLPTSGMPCLTAGTSRATSPIPGCGLGAPDNPGSGALRLTDLSNAYESSGIAYAGSFPTSAGLDVTFDQYQYGGGQGGADGITFELLAAPPGPTEVGPPGGANSYSPLSSSIAPVNAPGVPAGYLGVALDAFGNFSNTVDDGAGCTPDPSWATTAPRANQVTVRGPGTGTTGYCLLTSTLANTNIPIGKFPLRSNSATRPTSPQVISVQLKVPPTNQFVVGIRQADGTFLNVATGSLPTFYYDTSGNLHIGIPPRLTFAFAGTTGAGEDFHEISDVNAVTLQGFTPTLTLSKGDTSGGRVTAGGTILYTLTGGVAASSPATEAQPITITDPLPAGETLTGTPTGSGWDCSASTAAQVSCTTGATAAAGATLPTIDVAASVPAGAPASITNTATIISSDAAAPVSASDTIAVTPQSHGSGPILIALRSTTSALSCSPSQLLLGKASTCTVVVKDSTGATLTPGGTVTFTSPSGTFGSAGHCTLSPVSGHPGSSSCSLTYAPTKAGTDTIGAGYGGDAAHLGSSATTTVASAPVAGKTATVAILSGKVLIKLKNSNQFVLLSTSGAISIPIGSTVDALGGAVSMTTAADTLSPTNHDHTVDSGTFSEGLFAVKQQADTHQGVAPATNLVLQTPVGAVAKAKCRRTGPPGKGVVRSLRGVVKGVYRTVGAASTTTASNGTFMVQDRCDGTLTKVLKGRATVTYKQKHGRRTRSLTRTVRAGQSYLVKERFLADVLASR
jgi:hypothetical protein